jgi:hypothetical protein
MMHTANHTGKISVGCCKTMTPASPLPDVESAQRGMRWKHLRVEHSWRTKHLFLAPACPVLTQQHVQEKQPANILTQLPNISNVLQHTHAQ